MQAVLTASQEQRALDLLRRVIGTVTVNPPGGEEALARLLAEELEKAGLVCQVRPFAPGRANILARLPGREPELPALMLNGHLDTVPFGDRDLWQTPPEEAVVEDGILRGRGASDMKSGLCAAAFALATLAEEGFVPRRDILFLGTGDEESQGLGAQAAVEAGWLEGVGEMVIGEPTGNGLGVASKGTLWLEITLRGRTSHGAYPWEGINAAETACALVGEIKALVGGETHPYLTSPTCTLTRIDGGVKSNMVPDLCRMIFDVRTVPGVDHQTLIRRAREACDRLCGPAGVQWELAVLTNRMAVETDPHGALAEEMSRAVAAVTGKEPQLCGTGFFSDASIFLRSCSLPVVLFGPGASSEAHKPNETLVLERYYEAAACYRQLLLMNG